MLLIMTLPPQVQAMVAQLVETVEALDQSFAEAMAHKGPSLIEVML